MQDEPTEFMQDLFGSMRLEVTATARAWLYCFHCSKLVAVGHDDDIIGAALLGRGVPCETCGQALDPWRVLAESLKQATPGASVPIGLKQTSIAYRLRMDRPKDLDLEQEGIPANAQILNVRHSASPENCRIVDLEATDSARQPCMKYTVLGIWFGDEPAPDDIQGWTMVLWAQHDTDDIARQQLVTALEALANGRLRDAIVPATVAVENPLARALDAYFQWVGVSKDRRQRFLHGGAEFSHQLNVLAPAAASHLGAPLLSPTLRGSLNKLRDLRNQIAHTGHADDLTRETAAECLAAAIFGFRYARLLGEFIVRVQAQEKEPLKSQE